jgi:hypothetical protein
LDVVPRRAFAIRHGDRGGLRVAVVGGVVAAAVAQVDATDVGHVQVWAAGMAQDHELLVVRTAGAHPHVAQALTAGRFDLVAQMVVLTGAEPEPVGM